MVSWWSRFWCALWGGHRWKRCDGKETTWQGTEDFDRYCKHCKYVQLNAKAKAYDEVLAAKEIELETRQAELAHQQAMRDLEARYRDRPIGEQEGELSLIDNVTKIRRS